MADNETDRREVLLMDQSNPRNNSIQHTVALNMTNTQKIDIQFKKLTYEIQVGYRKPKKQILKELHGLFKSGELTAIMGPSGAGKSTLLNILTGYQPENLKMGTIDYISKNGKHNWDKYKKQTCYIQQTDCLHGLFTVYETMRIVAYLKIDKSISEKSRQMLIDEILDTLNLSKMKETRVNKLSGGERKRLSIALELINNPPIMFLDEPTTGLDSVASLQCVTTLRTLAKTGRTIICVIHQPSAALYQLFDYIYLMADGCCIYAGTPNHTVNYFAQQGFQCPKYHNPADYILEVVNCEYGNYNNRLIMAAGKYCRREESCLKSDITEETFDAETPKIQINPPSETRKFWILLHRFMLLVYRDWTVLRIRVIADFFVAILLGLIFQHVGDDGSKSISNVSYLFVTVLYFTYTHMMPAVLKFPFELAILKKEHFNNWYQLRTYSVAMIISTIPVQIFSTFIHSIISYLLTSQLLEWSRFFMYLLIEILTISVAENIGLILGTICNPTNGTFFAAISICIMLCLSGFVVFFSHMPLILYYISYLNYMRYSFDGLLQAIYNFHRKKLSCPSHVSYCHLRFPKMILKELYISRSFATFWNDVIILLIFYIILRIILYIILKRRLSKIY